MGLFSRKKKDDMEVQSLLDRANIASPTGATTAPAATPPAPAPGGGFQLPVEDVFSITGRGTVVTGQVAAGTVSKGMTVQIVRGGAVVASTRVTGVEMFRKQLDTATVGDNVGLLLDGVTREQVTRGDVVQG